MTEEEDLPKYGESATKFISEYRKLKKSVHRIRAHCNPLSDGFILYPRSPDYVCFSDHFPFFWNKHFSLLPINTTRHPACYDNKVGEQNEITVKFLDVGCGFGGLLFALSPLFPNTLILGMEIREKLVDFVGEKIRARRSEKPNTLHYANISVVNTNAMKYIVNYIWKGQLSKIFFCFPDPHFKKCNWRRRIITPCLICVYAYVLEDGGLLYTVTDVKDLYIWIKNAFCKHPMFDEIIDSTTLENDICLRIIQNNTNEAKKVVAKRKEIYYAVYKRKHESDILH